MSIDLGMAIKAIRPYMGCCVDCPHEHSGVDVVDAQALLAAALPHIEKQIREQIARETEAEASHYAEPNGLNPQEDGEYIGLTRAAEIARGTTRKDTDHA